MDPQPPSIKQRTSPRILWIPLLLSILVLSAMLIGIGIIISQKMASGKAYQLSGSFTQSVTSQNTDDFNTKMQSLGVEAVIMESFPPRFNIANITAEKCNEVRITLTTLPYLTNISTCQETIENPSEDPIT